VMQLQDNFKQSQSITDKHHRHDRLTASVTGGRQY
jgi:hypothetical protein